VGRAAYGCFAICSLQFSDPRRLLLRARFHLIDSVDTSCTPIKCHPPARKLAVIISVRGTAGGRPLINGALKKRSITRRPVARARARFSKEGSLDCDVFFINCPALRPIVCRSKGEVKQGCNRGAASQAAREEYRLVIGSESVKSQREKERARPARVPPPVKLVRSPFSNRP